MANDELMQPAEVEFSQFTATLLSEILDAVIEAQLGQEEKLRKLEEAAGFSVERFAAEVVSSEDVENELARLFPSAEGVCGVMAGCPYTPAKTGVEEVPPVSLTTGYTMRDDDWKKSGEGTVITEAGYQHISNHVRMEMATQQLANVLQLVRRGVPHVVVDHGRVNTKLTFQMSQVKGSTTTASGITESLKTAKLRSAKPLAQLSRMISPYKLTVKPADLRRPELLRLNVNLVGEVEITFKTVSE
jgi:hypothetical protein